MNGEAMGAVETPKVRPAAVALRQFTLDLQGVRRAAGEPTYTTLVKLMNCQFSKATISRVLNGARPSWRFTSCFLEACGISNSTIMKVWQPKWTDLQEALRPIDLGNSNKATGAECTICGG